MKKIEYLYPVTDWEVYDFADCYSSIYMFLERMPSEKVDFPCWKQSNGDCSFCGNCNKIIPPAKMKEDLNFIFQTFAGLSAGGVPWEGVNSALEKVKDDAADFILKYTGYGYESVNENMEEKIKSSIDSEFPVIAKLKNGNCHIIIGYDNDKLLAIKKNSEQLLSADEIENAYIITGKTKPSHTLCDALKRIKYVMDSDRDEKLWDIYINNFNADCGLEELKGKARKVDKAMIWNVHTFSRAFYLRRLKELQDERISKCINKLAHAYHESHEVRWQTKSICSAIGRMEIWAVENSKTLIDNTLNDYRALMQDTLRWLKNFDEIVYNAICEMIEILE
jgi:hypothetical protein